MPTCRARARILLKHGKASVYKYVPFTIKLNYVLDDAVLQPIELKIDPGSKTTGITLVAQFKGGAVSIFAVNLMHRGQSIKNALDARRALRRTRRARKTRYRAARFNNRTRVAGWLAPSLQSRVDNVKAWAIKFNKLSPITICHIETVRFDLQKMVYKTISGIEYQQGTLMGYEVREYLLEKWHRQCAYCNKQGIPLEIEHIVARSKGGTNRISNLTLACHNCNQLKGNQELSIFLSNRPNVLARIKSQQQAPLKDAAAVNATRYAIGRVIKQLGLVTEFWSGGRTKLNRISQGYQKDHWIDAACVGSLGAKVFIPKTMQPLVIKACGRGTRQVVRVDQYGFPRAKAGRVKRVYGFQTGDLVKLVQTKGKYAGTYRGRLAGVRADGRFDMLTPKGKVTASFKNYRLIQRADGYAYAS